MPSAPLPRPDMLMDNVLRLTGRSAEFIVTTPTLIEKEEDGFVFAWHYMDCDVIFHYREGAYRVKEIAVVDDTVMSRWRM